MQKQSDMSTVSWRRFLLVAFGVVTVSCLAMAQQTLHTVTVDFTKSPISYSDKYDSQTNAHAYRLGVSTTDTVVWQVVTPGANNSAAVCFPNGTPLSDAADQNQRPASMFVWSNRVNNSKPAEIVEVAGTYEYWVSAYDEDNKHLYFDDPKIIVGGGSAEAEARIKSALHTLRLAGPELSGTPKIQEKLEPIERELQQLINELNKSK